MGINFPASPTVGQKYPQPAVAGIPVYTWDGEKWTTVGGSIAAYAPPADAVPLVNAGAGLVGTSTDYAREDHVHPSDTSLMAYSGMQINGGMEVSQERGNTAFALAMNGTSYYVQDGWRVQAVAAATLTINASPLVPAAPPPISGFPYCASVTAGTGIASPATGDVVLLSQFIEGYRVARLNWGTSTAQPITISFWAYTSAAGTIGLSVQNSATNRSYVADVAITAAGTWEYKTVSIPGDTSGTWLKDSGIGIKLQFCTIAGSTFRASSANSWQAGNFTASPSTGNLHPASGYGLYVTGVTVLPGIQAPAAAQSQNLMRPFGDELATCQRYWHAVGTSIVSAAYSPAGGGIVTVFSFPTTMRATPSVNGLGVVFSNSSSMTAFATSVNNVAIQIVATAAGPAYATFSSITCDARL